MKPRFNIKQLKDYRRNLRNRSTSAEAEFWNHVKGRSLSGYKFRRQHSINNFIVDFYCPKLKLIIELDGDSHGDYYRIDKDEARDSMLTKMGFTVIRFENKFVFQDIEWVKQEILKTIEQINHPVKPGLDTPP